MESEPSGIAAYTRQLLTHVLQYDTRNTYVLFYNSYHTLNHLQKMFQGAHIEYAPFFIPNKLFNGSLTLFRYPFLDKLIGPIDLFFAPNWGFVNVSCQCKLVVTAHDMSYRLYSNFLTFKGRLWHQLIQPKKFFSGASHIIAVSEHTKNDLVRAFDVPREKISVIHSGASPSQGSKLPEISQRVDIHRKYNLPKHYIFSLGTLEPRKNIQGLVQAFYKLLSNKIIQQQYQDLTLVVAGARGWKNSALRDIRDRQVRFLGYIPNNDKMQIYQHAQIFVYPSFYEGFGFPPLEAALLGVPSVVSSVSSLPEIMKDGAVYVDPYNVDEIASGMFSLLHFPELRNDIVLKAKKVAASYSWKKTAEATVQLWERVLA